MKIKKILCMTLAVIMLIGLGSTAYAAKNPFTDVPNRSWYKDSVLFCNEKSIIEGKTSTTFVPSDSVTRAEFITMLFRFYVRTGYEGCEINFDLMEEYYSMEPREDGSFEFWSDSKSERQLRDYTIKFTDVEPDAYYGPAVAWAERHGYLYNTDATEFKPNETITREEMAVILYKFSCGSGIDFLYNNGEELAQPLVFYDENGDICGLEGEFVEFFAGRLGFEDYREQIVVDISAIDSYTDAGEISNNAKEGFAWAIQAGYITGTTRNKLLPQSSVTRAQVAVIIERMYDDVLLAQCEENIMDYVVYED